MILKKDHQLKKQVKLYFMEYKGYKISFHYNEHFKNGCYNLQKVGSSSSCEIDKTWTKIKMPSDKIIYNIDTGKKHLDKYINDLKKLIDIHIEFEDVFEGLYK